MRPDRGFKKSSSICVLLTFAFLLLFTYRVTGQYPANYQYTLLPDSILDKIISASSGDLAMAHLNSLAPYTKPRKSGDFPDNLGETSYITGKIKEYGIRNYSVDRVGRTTTWRGIKGTVWEISPGRSKIADFNDIPEMVAAGSKTADVRARLIWADEGQETFFENNRPNVKGKIVVTSGYPTLVHMRAMNAGAVGIISYYSSRSLLDPIQIPNVSVSGEGFAFMIPPREGVLLRDRLLRRENIEVEAKVESRTEPVDLVVPQCFIPGKDTTAGEIIFTAHLFEGYVKLGANDNMSGASVILEVSHLLNNLIERGEIPRPARSIRFLWVPETSGTISWVNMNLPKVKKAVCNINLDMVGARLVDSRSFLGLNRSGYSTAHFANDVMESFVRYVGETNIEGITDYLTRRDFSRRIISPTGTDDPFYYRINSVYGSSDNAVFNNWTINIPGLKLNTWPDNYYHSSEDNPDKCDPTQLRRTIVICAAGAYAIALGGDETAMRVMSEMFSSATSRLGIQMAKAYDMVWKSDAKTIAAMYKRAVYNIEGFLLAEQAALETVKQISSTPQIIAIISSNKEKLDELGRIQLSGLKEQMIAKCRYTGVPASEINTGETERNAQKIIPVPAGVVSVLGYGGERKYLTSLSPEFTAKYTYRGIFNTDEVAGLADGKRSILQIKKMVDAQFEKETPLQDIVNFFYVLREAGLMKF